MIGGFRIIEDASLTEAGDPITVCRSWLERLLSWPWCPWHSTKIVIPQVPRKDAIINHLEGYMIMHPELADRLRRAIGEQR